MRRLFGLLFGSIFAAGVAHAQPALDPHIQPPTRTKHVDPEYPKDLLQSGKDVEVVLTLHIDAEGHVEKAEVAISGGKEFDDAALGVVKEWEFEPAKRDGKPIPSKINVPFHFAPPQSPRAASTIPSQAAEETHTQPAPQSKPSKPPPAKKEEEEEAEDVHVGGHRPAPSRGASDFNIRVGELGRVPRENAAAMLKLAPSLMLTNEGGEGHAEQVFLRGFDAREGQDIEFTVDGVPINESGNLHGNGYADTHFIIPEVVESLRVVEGPYDPRQGNYAVAGSADYSLGLAKRGITGKYTGGSWNTQRGLLMWGPRGESEHTFAAAEIQSSDGYGQNRDSLRGTAIGQYEGKLGERGRWRVTATAYSTHYHSAGIIREDDYKSGRIGFYDSYDLAPFSREHTPEGGDASRYSVAGSIETSVKDTTLSQQVFLIKRDMRLLENFTGFLLDTQQQYQSLHLQRGDMLDLNVDETTVGARGFARFQTKALGEKQELEVGYFARGDWVGGSQQRIEATTGVPYLTETNLQSTLADIGLYGDASVKFGKYVNVRGGLRSDIFTFDVNDLCAAKSAAHLTNPPIDQSCLSVQDRGRPREPNQRSGTASAALLPRASLLLGPYRHLVLSGSIGEGVRSIDPSYITQDIKTPFASILSYEGGVTYANDIKGTSVVARSIFFQTHVDRDLIFSETVGRNVLGNGTTRTGWIGALRLTGKWLDESASVTFVKSAYDDTHLLVAYVPDVVVRSDTAIFHELPVKMFGSPLKGAISAGVTYVGPRALPYGQRSNDIFTLDMSATVSWRNVEIGVIATNLLNLKYRLGEFNYASDFHSQRQPTLVPERAFTAGPPLGVFGTLAINFGGGEDK